MDKTPNKSGEDTVQMIIRAVPKSIHRDFKAACAAKDTTIRARIIELMKLDAKTKK
ncbi:MAG TPA: hypothetical protein PKW17_11690 [Smithellaceae bacterium]|nr:hypothetical protein [Smithellaceae bacterium]